MELHSTSEKTRAPLWPLIYVDQLQVLRWRGNQKAIPLSYAQIESNWEYVGSGTDTNRKEKGKNWCRNTGFRVPLFHQATGVMDVVSLLLVSVLTEWTSASTDTEMLLPLFYRLICVCLFTPAAVCRSLTLCWPLTSVCTTAGLWGATPPATKSTTWQMDLSIIPTSKKKEKRIALLIWYHLKIRPLLSLFLIHSFTLSFWPINPFIFRLCPCTAITIQGKSHSSGG